MRRLLIALAALTVPSAAFAADQFDLTCTGTVTYDLVGQDSETKPFSATYAFDLTKQIGYMPGAAASFDVQSVTATKIVIKDRVDSRGEEAETIDRTTGRMSYRLSSKDGLILRSAECRLSPYTGIKEPAF